MPCTVFFWETMIHLGSGRNPSMLVGCAPRRRPARKAGQACTWTEVCLSPKSLFLQEFWPASRLRSKADAPVAQLDRASGYEPEGREFESLRARQFKATLMRGFFICAPRNSRLLFAPSSILRIWPNLTATRVRLEVSSCGDRFHFPASPPSNTSAA